VVDQKIYLDIFAFLRDIQTRRRTLAGYFFEREKIVSPFGKGGLRGIYFFVIPAKAGIQGFNNL
jgi:hypothetical protein